MAGIDAFAQYVLNKIEEDPKHSIGYYKTTDRLFRMFARSVALRSMPELADDWWFYGIHLSRKEIKLTLCHPDEVRITIEDGKTKSASGGYDGFFELVTISTETLSVDEYARNYGVKPVTVRQWIRRGKIRTAQKVGREWRIPELTDIPRRGFEEAYYTRQFRSNDQIKYPEYEYLEGSTSVHITQSSDNNDTFIVEVIRQYNMDDSTTIEMNTSEREKFELFLITHDEFKYQDGGYSKEAKNDNSFFGLLEKLIISGDLNEENSEMMIADDIIY